MYILYLTPACSHSGRIPDAKTGPEIREHLRRQAFGHHIGELVRRRHMQDAHVAKRHFLADEVNVGLNMLGPSMLDGVGGHVNGTDVAVDDSGRSEGVM